MPRTRSRAFLLGCVVFASYLGWATSAGALDRLVFGAPTVTGLVAGSWNLVDIDFPPDGATDLLVCA